MRSECFGSVVSGPGPAVGEAPASVSQGGAGTILLVDDDEQVRRLLVRVLRGSGYVVLPARGGEEALRLVASEAGGIDLLVTDVLMRPMGGFELAEKVSALRPGTRVLFISGDPEPTSARPREAPSGALLLGKPFRPVELVSRVRQLLGGPPVADTR